MKTQARSKCLALVLYVQTKALKVTVSMQQDTEVKKLGPLADLIPQPSGSLAELQRAESAPNKTRRQVPKQPRAKATGNLLCYEEMRNFVPMIQQAHFSDVTKEKHISAVTLRQGV